ncbi:MAG: hypothetical protein MUC49_00305 [Raineya sp.]|jgi:hypothetical protein|nr:hypothetical protein [Raineya sp.]
MPTGKIVSRFLLVLWLGLICAILYRFIILDTPEQWQESDHQLIISFFYFNIFSFIKYLAGFIIVSIIVGIIAMNKSLSNQKRNIILGLSIFVLLYFSTKIYTSLYLQQTTIIEADKIILRYHPSFLASSQTILLNTHYDLNYKFNYHVKQNKRIKNSYYSIVLNNETGDYILLPYIPKEQVDKKLNSIKSRLKPNSNPTNEIFSDRIIFEKRSEGLYITLKPRSFSWEWTIFILLFFIVFIGIGAAGYKRFDYKFLWGIFLVAFIAITLYFVFVQLINHQKIKITHTKIESISTPLPFLGNTSVQISSSDKIVKVFSKESKYKGNYEIVAELLSGKQIRFVLDTDEMLIRNLARKIAYEFHL